MAITDEQLNKLPVYAQAEIRQLRQKVQILEAKNEWLEDENRVKVAESNTAVTQGISNDTALKPFSQIRFSLKQGPDGRWRSSITVRVSQDGKSIEVMGDDALIIRPHVSNHVSIWLED